MERLQFRTTVEWEIGTAQDLMRCLARVGVIATTEQIAKALESWAQQPQKITRGWTTPQTGYKTKAKPKVTEAVVQEEEAETWT